MKHVTAWKGMKAFVNGLVDETLEVEVLTRVAHDWEEVKECVRRIVRFL